LEEIPRPFYDLGKCCEFCKVCFLVVYLEMFNFLLKSLVYKYAIKASLIFKTKSDQKKKKKKNIKILKKAKKNI